MLLEDLQLVLKVAELNSITAAASKLDISTASASTALKRVESALGTKLFIRTTRNLRLSSAGERYLPKCEDALQTLAQAKLQLKADQDIIDGELRVAISSDLGRNVVAPWVSELMQDYPELGIRLNLSDSVTDFYRDSVDVALRYVSAGALDDQYLYGYKICDVPHVLCASPDYLKQYGAPKHPDDLLSHTGVLYQLHDTTHDMWAFSKAKREYKIKMNSKHIANDGDMVRRWCIDGKGLALKSCLDVSADLLSGDLVPVMQDFRPTPTELWLVMPCKQSINPATRLLKEKLKKNCNEFITYLTEKQILDS
ncbi:LysR family transcriptional regulator [Vibrio sp. JC009]|uniref:LysR family transcriptional regulator n=1 Tax=Vibrio sp. JC009 TaxID=2912314 RepID=UPI0023B1A44F|nr:LysR family transcriptional regulator [Vibrio sp. JC009]WED24447.1 LysR family transcriptional regulator [Vibrio sp. JC009]